jgi:hypothetical protein
MSTYADVAPRKLHAYFGKFSLVGSMQRTRVLLQLSDFVAETLSNGAIYGPTLRLIGDLNDELHAAVLKSTR